MPLKALAVKFLTHIRASLSEVSSSKCAPFIAELLLQKQRSTSLYLFFHEFCQDFRAIPQQLKHQSHKAVGHQ